MILKRKPKNFKLAFEVVGCYCEHGGKILFLKRHDSKDYGGKWNLPAGKVKKGENHEEAIVREVAEETGISLLPGNLQTKRTYIVRYPEYDYLFHTFRIYVETKNVIIKNDEAQDYCWVTPVEALALKLVPDEDYCIRDAYNF